MQKFEDMKMKKNVSFSTPKIKEVVREVPKEKEIEKRVKSTPHVEPSIMDDDFVASSSLGGRKKSFRASGSKSYIRFFIFLIFIILIGYFAAMRFENVRVSIVPKNKLVMFEGKVFTASKALGSPIDYEIMIVSDKQQVDKVLTVSKEVSLKAKGTVTFYNEYSAKPQKINAGVHISDESGKDYTLDKAITIPGYKLDKNKVMTAGSVDAPLTSFLVGEAYNGEPKDFAVTSYKKTDKNGKIYAKAKTIFTGGAQGLIYTLSDEEKADLDKKALSLVEDNLYKKIQAEVPENYLLYKDATTFSTKVSEVFSKTPEAKVEIEGTVTGVLIKKDAFISYLKKTMLPEISEKELERVELLDVDKLVFNFAQPVVSITKDMQDIPFALTGDAEALWHPDVETLASGLVGIGKNSVQYVFKQDPGIGEATAQIFPPWQKSLPTDKSKIKIEIQQPKN